MSDVKFACMLIVIFASVSIIVHYIQVWFCK